MRKRQSFRPFAGEKRQIRLQMMEKGRTIEADQSRLLKRSCFFMSNKVLVETSARHLHVTQEVLETLFGKG